ncbi:hypothetical protein EV126DRAFT_72781 [Verticillium dahliae]|nr:hypothetical protein EV126DRAFT_72781 [Verticillium dahliae]
MGLLSFLSSRKSFERASRPSSTLQGQAYHATTPSSPPVRGTYPMIRNRAAAASRERLQRPRQQPQPQPRLPSLDSDSDGGAPAPFVPRFRDVDFERPRTAPNVPASLAKPSLQRRRNSLMKAPPVSFRKPRTDSTYSNKTPLISSKHLSGPSLHNNLQAPCAPFSRVRTNSLLTMNTGKGYVDLVDAQSQYVPLHFQTRIKAEGARDYGEDVADRNLGENSFDLTSPQAQAFYALTGTNPCEPPDSYPPPIWTSTFGDNGRPFQPQAPYNYPRSTTRRSSHHDLVNPLLQNPPFQSSSEYPSTNELSTSRLSLHMSQPSRVDRRQSLSSYIPSAPTSPYTETAPRPKSMHKPTRSANQLVSKEQRSSFRSSTSSGLGIYSHLLPLMQPEPPTLSAPFARDSVMLAKTNYSLPSSSKTSKKTHRRRTNDMRYSTREVFRHVDYSGDRDEYPRPSDASLFVSPLRLNNSRNHKTDHGYDSQDESDDWVDRYDLPTAANPPVSLSQYKQPVRAREKSMDGGYQRAKSLGPLHGRIRLDEIYERIPVRTSSLNQWSVSSNTPTISSTSSIRYTRPMSRHTPNTSIDLPVISPKNVSRSLVSRGSNPDDVSSYHTALNSTAHTPIISPVRVDANFNIDDHISSDDDVDADSFISRKEDMGEREQGLLFRNTGYGGDGLQLPGLLDSIPAAPPVAQAVHPMRHSRSAPLAVLTDISSGRRLTLGANMHEQGYATDDAVRDEMPEMPDEQPASLPREDLAPGRRGMKRISALGAINQEESAPKVIGSPIEEEKEEKIDIRAAVRLRKENKAKERAGGKDAHARGRTRTRSLAPVDGRLAGNV